MSLNFQVVHLKVNIVRRTNDIHYQHHRAPRALTSFQLVVKQRKSWVSLAVFDQSLREIGTNIELC